MWSHFTVMSAAAEPAQSRQAAAASPSFPSSLITFLPTDLFSLPAILPSIFEVRN
jgi:hypothetical protein